MTPIFIESKFLVYLFSIKAITLFPFIITDDINNNDIKNKQLIHFQQQLELLVIPYFIIYLFFFLINFLIYHNSYLAYKAIPFEKEAYNSENNPNYIRTRKSYFWFRYI